MGSLLPPPGFIERRADNVVCWVKAGWEDHVTAEICSRRPQPAVHHSHSSVALKGGRGTIQRIQLTTQDALIVRPYRRGGFVRHFTRDLYWDYPPRPFVELCCSEEVRRRGVPAVEVLGAQVEYTIAGLYRGWLMTREAAGFHTLWDWLRTETATNLRQHMLRAVAHAIAALHKAGIAHADLNPTNLLVRPASDLPQVLFLDFDRARLFPHPVHSSLCEANLRRFQRFFKKYDPRAARLTATEFACFSELYHTALL